MSRTAYDSVDPARGTSLGTFVVDLFLPWLVGDFVPFGDLVSNVLLWLMLPETKPDDFGCSEIRYKVRNHEAALNLRCCCLLFAVEVHHGV